MKAQKLDASMCTKIHPMVNKSTLNGKIPFENKCLVWKHCQDHSYTKHTAANGCKSSPLKKAPSLFWSVGFYTPLCLPEAQFHNSWSASNCG